ncbi:MAG TPA: hypothetical protein VK453_07505 [Micromonosporaceae bacterium]|nr:hypothetical protein [Micromonosporaceae bacterium]
MPVPRTSRVRYSTVAIAATLLLTGLTVAAPAQATASDPVTPPISSRVTPISVNTAGIPGDRPSGTASVTPDGRFVVFQSGATNLVGGAANGQDDVFLRDRRTGSTELISVARTGRPGNGASLVGTTAISADGRFVAFRSTATDLVAGVDGNGIGVDAYVRDRLTRTTVRVSGDATLTHNESPSISGDGRFVAFVADDTTLVPGDTNLVPDVFVHDRRSATVRRASVGPDGVQGNAVSATPVLNGNGRFVAFHSFASNLVAGDSHVPDMFVRDLRFGRTERVSYGPTGGDLDGGVRGAPSISSDGRLVTFSAYDLQVYLRDRTRGVTTVVSAGRDGQPSGEFSHTPMLSPDGRFVTFHSGVGLTAPDPSMVTIYRRDLRAATTTRLRLNTTDGAPLVRGAYLYATSNAGVVFSSDAPNLDVDGRPSRAEGATVQLYLANW